MRTACALIRRSRFDALPREARADLDGQLPSDRLDKDNRNRDYLYGRLLALADLAEYEATDRPDRRALPTNAVRLTQRFVQLPQADMAASARQTLALSRHAGQRRQSGGLHAHDR